MTIELRNCLGKQKAIFAATITAPKSNLERLDKLSWAFSSFFFFKHLIMHSLGYYTVQRHDE